MQGLTDLAFASMALRVLKTTARWMLFKVCFAFPKAKAAVSGQIEIYILWDYSTHILKAGAVGVGCEFRHVGCVNHDSA